MDAQPTQSPRCYTVYELAAALQVLPDTVYDAIGRREIDVVRIGRAIRIPEREFCRMTGTSGSREGGA